jgi:hypothetical protein
MTLTIVSEILIPQLYTSIQKKKHTRIEGYCKLVYLYKSLLYLGQPTDIVIKPPPSARVF